MEAAVLKPAMVADVDCNSNSLNAELEVKKLQELVRKLERQNEQLRSRASGSAGPHALPPAPSCTLGSTGGYCLPSPAPSLLCESALGSFEGTEDSLEYFLPHYGEDGAAGEAEDGAEPSVLDELELLDLNSLSCSDESDETWLYVSSRAREVPADPVTPLQWCRQNLDSPQSEVEAARRSLSVRLEQVSRWRSSLSSPSPCSSPAPPPSRVAGVSPICVSPPVKPCSTPQSAERHAPPLSSPLHPLLRRTLSPVGKELPLVSERSPSFLPHSRSRGLRHSAFSPQSSVEGDVGPPEEDESITLGYKLQDLTDVQVMARLQEESLRQDYASMSSLMASRRSQSFSLQLSAGRGVEEEDEEDDEDYGFLPPPPPRLTRLPHSHTFSSIREWRRSTSSLSTPPSTPSTPPYPSAGLALQHQSSGPGLSPGPGPGPGLGLGLGLHLGLGLGLGSLTSAEPPAFRPGSDKLRRSMPNLVRAPSMPCVPLPTNPSASPCLLRSSQSFDSCSGLTRLQSSSQLQQRIQSLGQPLKATAYVSPTIKGSAPGGLQALTGGGSSIPLLSKPATGGMAPTSAPSTPRSSLPRPASFIGTTSSTPRSKAAQSGRSLLTPSKTLSSLSALRDAGWRDGCY